MLSNLFRNLYAEFMSSFKREPLFWIALTSLLAILILAHPSSWAHKVEPHDPTQHDRVTAMDHMPPEQWCGVTSTIIYGGMIAATKGVDANAEIDWAEAKSIEENPNFRPFNENERAWLFKHYTLGIETATGMKGDGDWPAIEVLYDTAGVMYRTCLESFTGEHHGEQNVNLKVSEDRVDAIMRKPVAQYCEYIAVLYASGINARTDGRPLLFKHSEKMGPGEWYPAPTDAIYLIGYDRWTTREKMFVLEHITAGWTYADEQYAKGKEIPNVGEPYMDGAMAYMEDCVRIETHKSIR